jgi:hypothetical protein
VTEPASVSRAAGDPERASVPTRAEAAKAVATAQSAASPRATAKAASSLTAVQRPPGGPARAGPRAEGRRARRETGATRAGPAGASLMLPARADGRTVTLLRPAARGRAARPQAGVHGPGGGATTPRGAEKTDIRRGRGRGVMPRAGLPGPRDRAVTWRDATTGGPRGFLGRAGGPTGAEGTGVSPGVRGRRAGGTVTLRKAAMLAVRPRAAVPGPGGGPVTPRAGEKAGTSGERDGGAIRRAGGPGLRDGAGTPRAAMAGAPRGTQRRARGPTGAGRAGVSPGVRGRRAGGTVTLRRAGMLAVLLGMAAPGPRADPVTPWAAEKAGMCGERDGGVTPKAGAPVGPDRAVTSAGVEKVGAGMVGARGARGRGARLVAVGRGARAGAATPFQAEAFGAGPVLAGPVEAGSGAALFRTGIARTGMPRAGPSRTGRTVGRARASTAARRGWRFPRTSPLTSLTRRRGPRCGPCRGSSPTR